MRARWLAKRALGSLPSGSSQSRTVAEARTYDILDAGPNFRFVIRTEFGPVIAHNCGYMLGGGDEMENKNGDIVRTGLWGYAEAMGVKMAREQAHESVRVFRSAYPEVVQFWYALRDAAFACVRECTTIRVGRVVFNGTKGLMRVKLPNGRCLNYIAPRIEKKKREFTKTLPDGSTVKEVKEMDTLTYMNQNQLTKKWERTATHPGKITENLVQTVARDVLWEGLERATAKGFEVALHVHDEIVCEVPLDSKLTIEDLCSAMADPIDWADGLPLAAEGIISPIYKK
jgi:DNA polymerase